MDTGCIYLLPKNFLFLQRSYFTVNDQCADLRVIVVMWFKEMI